LLKKHPRKTLWYIASNWGDEKLVTDEDIKNFKYVLEINYKLCFSESVDGLVVSTNLMHHTLIIITSQNQYLKKEITSEQQRMFIRYIYLKRVLDLMKDLSSSEDLEAPTPEFISLLDKMMNSLVSAQPEAASSEISTREKMSSISDALEKFKENLDPDLIKILNFIKDNPGIKNPELQDCPLSKFSKGVARRLSRNLL
jgi:hypothetical protein